MHTRKVGGDGCRKVEGVTSRNGPPICNICKASRRGAIVSVFSGHRGRVRGCHGCESFVVVEE
jgi:hypothetical protein